MVHFGLTRSILVHLGPPTVLWPRLNVAMQWEAYRDTNQRGSDGIALQHNLTWRCTAIQVVRALQYFFEKCGGWGV